MIGFIIGFVLGAWFGVLIMAAVAISRDYGQRQKENEEDDT